MKLETELHRAQGLGSAKNGVGHWIAQRISAIVLIPLCVWFVASFIYYVTSSYDEAQQWMSSSLTVAGLILFTGILFYHGYLGLQVIIEDYVSELSTRSFYIIAIKILSLFMTILATISIIQIYLS